MENREIEKGEMRGGGVHSFFVLNLTTNSFPDGAKVTWSNSDSKVSLDVGKLPPGIASPMKDFFRHQGKRIIGSGL
ncbi:hypothetical protein [Paraburkholderia sp. BR10882]|uniref:hypothetical protein n=1 Tax=unclassified Paraburkholderia TaxID=2615204 RepID=UPI0034CD9A8C